jgi:hypothetical protein
MHSNVSRTGQQDLLLRHLNIECGRMYRVSCRCDMSPDTSRSTCIAMCALVRTGHNVHSCTVFLHIYSRELEHGGWLNLAPKERRLLISLNQAKVRIVTTQFRNQSWRYNNTIPNSSRPSHGGIIIISGVKECQYLIPKVRIIAAYPNRYIPKNIGNP